MKKSFKQLLIAAIAIIISAMMLYSCTATVKVPKHPGPGEPPPPPKVQVN